MNYKLSYKDKKILNQVWDEGVTGYFREKTIANKLMINQL